jgi:haloacetate dehalogenase
VFEGFERERIQTSETEIELVRGGEGPPVLLLHGYPQTHAMWHLLVPRLAEDFTVVAADLRGYGDSSKPFGEEDHSTYSKRAMAGDQAAVMESLGFDSFAVVGHDRGGRVAHRMTLDYPDRVTKLAVLDIVPTRHIFETVGKELATAYYHWFFYIQPYDLPETLIGGNPSYTTSARSSAAGARAWRLSPRKPSPSTNAASTPPLSTRAAKITGPPPPSTSPTTGRTRMKATR